mgnify:CR=1 FL=1
MSELLPSLRMLLVMTVLTGGLIGLLETVALL